MVWERNGRVRWAALLLPIMVATVAPGLPRAEPRTVVVEPGSQSAPAPSQVPQPATSPPEVSQPRAPEAGTSEGQPGQSSSQAGAPVPNTPPGQPDLRGTKSAPLAVEITNAADLQSRSGSERPGQTAAGHGHGALRFLGSALAIIALIQIVVFGLQAIWLKRTVARMDATAEQRMRAYISVTPVNVTSWNQSENISISLDIENHGQTIGSDIRYEFGIDIIDRLPSDAVMPATSERLTANNALFPEQKRSVRLEFKRTATAAEVTAVEAGLKRLYLWGTLFYRDAFGNQRTTGFSFSAGGAGFAQIQRGPRGTLTAWHWEFGAHHNAAT
jgi:hypothetical protein